MRKRTPKQMLLAYLISFGVALFVLQSIAWLALNQFGLVGNLVYIAWLSVTIIILFAKDIADVISAKFRKSIFFNHPLLEHCPYSALVAYLSPVVWVSLLAAANAIFGFCKDIALLR
jgi:hypothetical protein